MVHVAVLTQQLVNVYVVQVSRKPQTTLHAQVNKYGLPIVTEWNYYVVGCAFINVNK